MKVGPIHLGTYFLTSNIFMNRRSVPSDTMISNQVFEEKIIFK